VSIGGEFRTAKRFTTKAASALRAPALLALILLILSSAQAASATSPSDDFNRANGSLGANWTAISDGALTISSQAVVGASATAGAIRTAETYTSDQSSQIQTTSTQLSGGQWVGPSVRTQNNGQTTYLGLYFWNSGSPQLRLYKRSAGTWIQLGSSYNSGALAAGTTLQLTATGSTISFLQNGVSRITVSDTSITGGAPGIMTYGQGTADNWVGGGAGGSTPTYAVGGSVSGLSGTVVLQDNGGDNLSVSANGPFSFATKLAGGAAYNVTVKTNPSGQTCSVTNGSGTIGSADISNVAVSCSTTPTYAVGGNLSGLSGTVVLQDNGGDNLSVSANGPFAFATKLAGGAAYAVTVKTNPSGQTCSVTNGSGTIGSADISNVAVSCSTNPTYAVGGSVSFLSGTVVLQDNGGDNLSVSANGPFSFATKLAGGAAYNVTVKTNPSGQTCSVTNGSGTIGSADISNVAVSCSTTPTYAVGGNLSGLSGTVVLQDNGGDNLSVSANGPFAFATKLAGGAAYAVTVKTNPSGQTCSVTNGSGTIGSADVTNVAVSCSTAPPPTGGTDDFNRADGSLGSNWSSVNDGALTISSQAVLGTSATAGAIRTAETYTSDQSSQIQLTSTQLSGSQWVGPTVRTQSGGQTTYLGIYYWNSGSPQLQLYKRIAGAWTQLGSSYNSGALPAGTTLQLSASGSTISLLQNGVARITATDGSISGGAPGIMTYGQATADNWVGSGTTPGPGNSGFNATYRSTDANGVDYYDVTSNDNGTGIQTLRVLAPTNPAAGVPHNFLYLLPVEAGLGTVFGDGIATLEALDAQNQYNLTIVEPSFATEPWYADNPNDASLHYDTFMTKDLVPWATQNLATSGHEQNWLIGFSKSGIGGQGLLLNHPDVFTLAASWDFPADMSTYGQFIGSADQYGTDANFQANYRLTPLFLEAHKLPLTTSNRIWIGSYQTFQTDVSDYDALLNSEGIPHTTEAPMYMAHRWDSGWVQIALAALHQDSQNLLTSP
jgi:predicted transcriptional regulator